MYQRFFALALILAITVDAQDYNSNYAEPAPMPNFPDEADFTMISIPSDFGNFENNIQEAGFVMWVESDNTDLNDWIASFDFIAAGFGAPNYEVFGGGIKFV